MVKDRVEHNTNYSKVCPMWINCTKWTIFWMGLWLFHMSSWLIPNTNHATIEPFSFSSFSDAQIWKRQNHSFSGTALSPFSPWPLLSRTSCRLKSLATWMFVWQFVKTNNKDNIKTCINPLGLWFLLTEGQYCGNRFHDMTSSCWETDRSAADTSQQTH